MGWATILYLAALTSIDPQLLEAAAIDGAGRFQRVLYIILPGVLPTLLLVLCLDFGLLFNAAGFDQVLNLYNPAVYSTGDILDTWIYREGLLGGAIQSGDGGGAGAFGAGADFDCGEFAVDFAVYGLSGVLTAVVSGQNCSVLVGPYAGWERPLA